MPIMTSKSGKWCVRFPDHSFMGAPGCVSFDPGQAVDCGVKPLAEQIAFNWGNGAVAVLVMSTFTYEYEDAVDPNVAYTFTKR
mgnify:FL=1